MGALKARLMMRTSKSEKDPAPGDYFGRQADYALKLECYGNAALIYWNVMTSTVNLTEPVTDKNICVPLTKDDVIHRFLYCIDKLGAKEILKNFKDGYQPTFEKLDRDLDAFRKQ